MDTKDEDIEIGERDALGRLRPGHAKLGGRVSGVRNWNARRVAESLNRSPLIVALTVLKTGFFSLAKGEKPEDQRRASAELFTKILLDCLKLTVPSVSSVQLTGQPATATASLDVTALIMSDPDTARMASDLAIKMAQQQRQIEPRFPPDSFDDSLTTSCADSNMRGEPGRYYDCRAQPLYQNVSGFLPDSTLQPNDFRQQKYVYHI